MTRTDLWNSLYYGSKSDDEKADLYLMMADWCEEDGLQRAADLYRKSSQSHREHAERERKIEKS